jgi:hypothetical protein
MSEARPGWYSDPAGGSGRFRYWDGSRWSTVTTDDPSQPRPAELGPTESTPQKASEGGAGRPLPRRRIALIVGVLAVVVTAVVAVAAIMGNFRQTVGPPPRPIVSGSPSPQADPTQTRSPSPTPATPIPGRCPKGDPNLRAPHPNDGRVHGGNLSFAEQPTFDPATLEGRFSFAYDVLQQTLPVSQNPAWIAQLAVGQLRASDGFVHDARNTVESFAQCVARSPSTSPILRC